MGGSYPGGYTHAEPSPAAAVFGLNSSLSHPIQALPAALPEDRAPIGVVLVIASRLERLGWSVVLERQEDMRLLGQFPRCREAFAFLEAHPPDVVLIDEGQLTAAQCEVVGRYAARSGARVLLVAPHPLDEPLSGSRYAFASECLLKGLAADELLTAIRRQGPSRGRPARRCEESSEGL